MKINNDRVSCDVWLAGATCSKHETGPVDGRSYSGHIPEMRGLGLIPGPSSSLLRALVALCIASRLKFIENVSQLYCDMKDELRCRLSSLLSRGSHDRRYVFHMTINGSDEADTNRLFHTMSQHFRKLQKRGVALSWLKFLSFDRVGNGHIHVAVFHNIPLPQLFKGGNLPGVENAVFDLPQFKCKSDRLRPVWQHRRLARFRSYNYKIQIVPHDNPRFLLTDYFLRPTNFQPDKVRACKRQWFTTSRDIIKAGSVHGVFNRIVELFDYLRSALHCLGMDSAARLVVRSLILGKTERLEQLAVVGCLTSAATPDSGCNSGNDIWSNSDKDNCGNSGGTDSGDNSQADGCSNSGGNDDRSNADTDSGSMIKKSRASIYSTSSLILLEYPSVRWFGNAPASRAPIAIFRPP